MMRNSLQLRVAILAAGIATLAVAISAFLFDRSTRREFRTYLKSRDAAPESAAIPARLEKWYQSTGTWNGVAGLLDTLDRESNRNILILDPSGKPIAAAPQLLAQSAIERHPDGLRLQLPGASKGPQLRMDLRTPGVAILALDGTEAARVFVFPPSPPRNEPRPQFLDSIRRSVLLAAILAVASALLLSILLTRAILRPVRSLTEVARALERGDWTRRANIASRDEVGELGAAFNSLVDTLERNERLRRDLVNDVAHELRTPLTNVQCHVEAMLDGLAQPDRETLSSLHEETLLLNRLVDDLRDLALAEAGKLHLSPQPCSIAEELERVVHSFRAAAAEKGIRLSWEASEPALTVHADPARLGQILRNLLANAIRHTPEGGFVIARAGREPNAMVIAVTDSGCGIASHHLPHIFDRFYRADEARNRHSGGAGLGLPIVKHLTHAHGGTVSATSQEGKGTTITLRLPRPT